MQPALKFSTAPAANVDFHTVDSIPLSLREMIDYALEGKGGGFRLNLARATGTACGLNPKATERLAEAVESFHHASLIFDDLPCMDDAVERRGRRCLHRVAGESKAILAALALVNRAYTLSWKVSAQYPEYSEQAGRAVERCIGELGILDGQDRDLSYHAALGAKEVKAIAARKTGALLQLTLLLPAILGGASFNECLRLSRMARAWGIAYQALDDFSDLLPSLMKTGKTPFQDLRQDRPNLVIALGQAKAAAELQRYMAQAHRQIEALALVDAKWCFLFDFHAVLAGKATALQAALGDAES
ncbi:polyprenyl synthetase family protein [Coraliomargarita sp. W4R72]